MMHARLCITILLFICINLCSPFVLYAQEADTDPRAEKFWREFDATAKSLAIVPADAGPAYHLDTKPLFQFASDGLVHGRVYIWYDQHERLALIGTIGSIPIGNSDSEFVELHLLRPIPIQPLTIGGYSRQVWTPTVDGLSPRPLSEAPAVAATATRRMVQLRGIARRFAATMTQDGKTHQLRLLPQPIFRYSNSTAEKDGALFAMVFEMGTDPEVLIRVESSADDAGQLQWTYQPIRLTWRAVTLDLDDNRVWNRDEFRERDMPMQTTPYLTGLRRAIP